MKKISVKKILFLISLYLCGVFLAIGIFAAIFGVHYGFPVSTLYIGLKGLLFGMVLFVPFPFLAPLLLIALIYIIIYLIVRYKEKRQKSSDVNNKS